jgi:hypothetical protein
MRSTSVRIGKLGLEGLMDRANIAFTNGYRFKGEINSVNLQHSINAICQCINKFSYQVHFISQNNYSWQQTAQPSFKLNSIMAVNLENAFAQVCQDSHNNFAKQKQVPMLFTLIQGTNTEKDEFLIAQTSCHTHVDARSSEVIFNKIVEHYNALCQQDEAKCKAITTSVKQLQTVDADVIIQQRFTLNETASHNDNIANITSYQVDDVGHHALPMANLDALLPKYKATERSPFIQYFNVEEMLTSARKKHAHISKNSVVCAAIVKAIYNINVQQKGVAAEHNISFKMLSDLLSPQMRQQYCGNYIAFVPVTVNGNQPLEDIAKDINDRIINFKTSNVDVSIFALTEAAIEEALVGSADEPLSFIVTNWNNFTFTNQEDYLTGCQSLRHQSGVNIEPKDNLGAALVNRPVLVINFSPNGELCLSQFPSLDSETVNQNLATQFDDVFSTYET